MSEARLPWVVVDNEVKVGDRLLVVARFRTHEAAAEWIGKQDPAKVERGGYGLDGPEEELNNE